MTCNFDLLFSSDGARLAVFYLKVRLRLSVE